MKPTVLVLWNQVDDDVFERWRARRPPRSSWAPVRSAADGDSGALAEDMARILAAVGRVHVLDIEDEHERLWAAIRRYRPEVVLNLVEFLPARPVMRPRSSACSSFWAWRIRATRPWRWGCVGTRIRAS
ncbi:hypothetical protein [Haliangium ochraceum]|uniref:hypothetical protein n=1 Tax=Haliangium ochraceum TaxID=80816 RepID=UPI00019BA925|nr:hypothetical protein [Haliangium ochraceum]